MLAPQIEPCVQQKEICCPPPPRALLSISMLLRLMPWIPYKIALISLQKPPENNNEVFSSGIRVFSSVLGSGNQVFNSYQECAQLLRNISLSSLICCRFKCLEDYSDSLSSLRLTVQVPTGIASFPNEILHTPQAWAKKKYTNIISFHFMPRGGHFAAFEEPELLAKDILQFVDKVEKEQLWKKKGE